MRTPKDTPSATDAQFDELAKAVAHGLTRRKTLQLLSGGVSGLLWAFSGPRARAATTASAPTLGGAKGCAQLCAPLSRNQAAHNACLEACQCGQLCAPLFNLRAPAPFVACAEACVDCKTCKGSAALTLTSPQMLVCTGATPCRSGSGLACCTFDAQTPQNSQVCCSGTCSGPCVAGQTYNCSTHACECLTGTLCNGTCVTCGTNATLDPSTCACVCNSGYTLCNNSCVSNCPQGQTLDPTTCTCGCASGTTPCGGTCCPTGQTCLAGVTCCPTAQVCGGGGTCCPTGQTCQNGEICCSPSQVCAGGALCCPTGQTCQNDQCV